MSATNLVASFSRYCSVTQGGRIDRTALPLGDFVWSNYSKREDLARPGPRHIGYVALSTGSVSAGLVVLVSTPQPGHGPGRSPRTCSDSTAAKPRAWVSRGRLHSIFAAWRLSRQRSSGSPICQCRAVELSDRRRRPFGWSWRRPQPTSPGADPRRSSSLGRSAHDRSADRPSNGLAGTSPPDTVPRAFHH